MDKKTGGKKLSRRIFLKGAVAGLGAIGMAAFGGGSEAKTVNIHQILKWDYTADVVVVGYGAAGGAAAVAAHDAGARVIILEKMPKAGGNSAVCYGGMAIPKSVSAGIEYYGKLSFGTIDSDTLHGFAEAMAGVPDLLKKLGGHVQMGKRSPAFPALYHSDMQAFRFAPTGKAGFQFLSELVEERRINVMLNTAAENLIQIPETGEIAGVKASRGGQEIFIKARKGVVLSCGGYENNPEMFGYYNFPGLEDFIFPLGTPANTGDGLKLASEAGAYLWHTASLQWGGFCAKAPSKKYGVAVGMIIPRREKADPFILVNKYGRRFMNEAKRLTHNKGTLEILHFDHDRAEYTNVPAYMIFDETYRKGGPIERGMWGDVGYSTVNRIYAWSENNATEIEKGWIIKADTVSDLAARLKMDQGGLRETVAKFNGYCASGNDVAFARSIVTMAPVEKPPYYAIELGLALVNTQGGPKHDRYARILDPDNRPIPRLYAAGELGSFFGFLYQEGSNYPEAWAIGYIAGTHAAAQKSLKG